MSEAIFILTTIFVAYVVFTVVSDEKKTTNVVTPKGNATNAFSAKKVEEKKVVKAKAKVVGNNSLRNPATGDIAKIPNNYRFSKRWIKEALVEEGLLNKIYKNDELNDETNAKIYQALAKLHAIKKYQA